MTNVLKVYTDGSVENIPQIDHCTRSVFSPWALLPVLVSCACHNKLPCTLRLSTRQIRYLTVIEAEF